MELDDAGKLARELMAEHGLVNWSLQWFMKKQTYGACQNLTKTIYLSTPMVLLNDDKAVREVMLHEIAHALAPLNAKHGPAWKRIATQIGARPNRLFTDDHVKPPYL